MSMRAPDEIDTPRRSVPMSPAPLLPPPRQQTIAGETAEAQRDRYRAELLVLRPLADRVLELEKIVGRPPNPMIKGDTGTLLAGRSFEVEAKLDAVTVALDALTAELAADRLERETQRRTAEARDTADAARAATMSERRRERPVNVGWAVITAVACSLALGAVGMLGGYVALHWRSDALPAQAGERPR